MAAGPIVRPGPAARCGAGRARRVGLVGFGSIAEHAHLPAWQAIEDVEVTAVADISPARLARARRLLPHVTLYESPHELAARADLDCVDICTPPATHADLITAACARGIAHIVCEKPLVLSEREYRRVVEARTTSGSRVVCVNNWRHSDLNRHVASALAAGAIGAVESVELRIGRPDCALGSAAWMPRWRTEPRLAGGGIILDHGWHQLSLLLGWMGTLPESVRAVTRTVDRRHHPVEDEALIEVAFPSGTGLIELSWVSEGRTNDGVVRGPRGTIVAHDDRVVIENGDGRRELPFRGRLSASSYHPDWFETVFRQEVLASSPVAADGNLAEAGILVSAICAAYRSARACGGRVHPDLAGLGPDARPPRPGENGGRSWR
jgi:predicted dehydrogenase